MNSSRETQAISVIKAYSKGFFIAGDKGSMVLWVKSEENDATSEKQAFDFIRKWTPLACKDINILSLDLSPSEEVLAFS